MARKAAYDISITGTVNGATGLKRLIRRTVVAAMQRHEVSAVTLNVALVDDETMARLNQDYLHHKGPTDVLAFDLRDNAELPKGKSRANQAIDGEIVVSVETARRQAAARGLDVTAEVALYTLHGTLHLLGYEDKSRPGAANMHRLEDEILSELGLGRVFRAGP